MALWVYMSYGRMNTNAVYHNDNNNDNVLSHSQIRKDYTPGILFSLQVVRNFYWQQRCTTLIEWTEK